MKHFEVHKLDKEDHRRIDLLANICRILLTPMFLFVRIYCWVWDYDYSEFFGRE